MNKTKNDLQANVRKSTVDLLQPLLSGAIDLLMQSKQAHWNVKGSSFMALHKLFDDLYGELSDHVDLIAERIVALGGQAYGTIRYAAKNSQISEYPLDITDGTEHVDALSSALAEFGKSVRSAIDAADSFGDKGTSDLCTEISRSADKYLWFIEAHLPS